MNNGFYKEKIDDIILIDLNLDSRYQLYVAVNVETLNSFRDSDEYHEFKTIYGDLLKENAPSELNEFQPIATICLKIYYKKDDELNRIIKPILYNIANLIRIPNYIFSDVLLKLSEYKISEKHILINNLTVVNNFNSNTTEVYLSSKRLKFISGIEKEYVVFDNSKQLDNKSEELT